MKLAVLSETSPGERRVSASPDTVKAYVKKGLTVGVQAGAGAIASGSTIAMVFGFLALILASVNIFGGFLVTSRMLAMYKKKGK